jgi:hypothetical protein
METQDKCVQCNKPASIRGLCRAHYAQFDKIKKAAEANGADLEAFDEDLVLKGLVLPDQKKQPNRFEEALAEFIKKNPPPIPRSTPEQNAEMVKKAQEFRKNLPTKSSKKPSEKRKAE